MNALIKLAKKIFDTLPFSGDKSKIAGWSTIYGVIHLLYPQLVLPADPTVWIATSVGAFVLARAHRWLKKNHPEIPWPSNQ